MGHATRTNPATEAIVPFTVRVDQVPKATRIRSTLLVSSQQSLRTRDLYERYLGFLAPEMKRPLSELVAGVWCPIEWGTAHYEACERLALSNETLLSIGHEVEERLRGSILLHFARVSREVGASPVTVLAQSPRFWDRVFVGSQIGLFRLGPKDVRFELAGYPFAPFTYNRVSFRGILESVAAPFCTKVFVRDAPEAAGPWSVGWRVSWV